MTFLPIASWLAKEATARTAQSARPDAPVIPDDEPSTTPSRTSRLRVRLSRALRRTADAIEPAPACEPR